MFVLGDEVPCFPGRDPLVVSNVCGGLQQAVDFEVFLVRVVGVFLVTIAVAVAAVFGVFPVGLKLRVGDRDAVLPKLLAPLFGVLDGAR